MTNMEAERVFREMLPCEERDKGGLYRRVKRLYRAWKFVRKWNKKNKDWRECRHKRKRRTEAMRKAGIKW